MQNILLGLGESLIRIVWNVSRSEVFWPLLDGLCMSFVSLWKVPSRSRSRGRVLDFILSSRRGQGSALGNGKLRVACWS